MTDGSFCFGMRDSQQPGDIKLFSKHYIIHHRQIEIKTDLYSLMTKSKDLEIKNGIIPYVNLGGYGHWVVSNSRLFLVYGMGMQLFFKPCTKTKPHEKKRVKNVNIFVIQCRVPTLDRCMCNVLHAIVVFQENHGFP